MVLWLYNNGSFGIKFTREYFGLNHVRWSNQPTELDFVMRQTTMHIFH